MTLPDCRHAAHSACVVSQPGRLLQASVPVATTRPVPPSPAARPAQPSPIVSVQPLPATITHRVNHNGYLESYTLGLLLAVSATAVAIAWTAAAIARRARGRRLFPALPRWAANGGSGLTVFVLLLAGVLVLVNNYVGYVPSLNSLFRPPTSSNGIARTASDADRSRVIRLRIPAPSAGIVTGTTYVYLPPGYDQPSNADRRYPVIYLIHGYPGRAADWFIAGRLKSTMDLLIETHYIGPMIVVSPTASSGYFHDDECLDSPGRVAVESYLSFDVVDAIDRAFRTVPDRAHRAIGGMSSGGYCAMNIALHHLHRFSIILASEPYGDPGMNPFRVLLDHSWARWRTNSPTFYIPRWDFSLPVAAFLDSGSADRSTTTDALRLAALLAARGQAASYRVAVHQHHNWREARAALPYALIFAWQHFGKLPDGGSDAADARQVDRLLQYALTLPPPRTRAQATHPPSPSETAPVASPAQRT